MLQNYGSEVRNGKNVPDHLDLSLGLLCTMHFLVPSPGFF